MNSEEVSWKVIGTYKHGITDCQDILTSWIENVKKEGKIVKLRPHYAEWCRATGSIDTVEQVWTCLLALLSHAGPNRTQPELSRYGSKEVDKTTVVWTC